VLVRTRPGTDISRAINTAVWRIDPDQSVEGPWAVRTWIDERTAYLRFLATLTALLAGLGVVLAAAGLQGLMTYWVEASGRELGIRRAIGASDRSILAWFTKRWLRVVGPALIAATLIQVGVLRVATTAIEGLQSASVGQLVTGGAIVVLYAAAASAFALWRALRVDPRVLMR
jgi:putative ABC transport system permease protein